MGLDISMSSTESFIDEKESRQQISNTFITLSFVFLGMLITALLYWAYQRTEKLFITLFSFMVFTYSLMMVVFIAVVRSKLTMGQFKIFMTASIFMAVSSLVLFLYFVIKTMQFFRRSNVASGNIYNRSPGYVSPTLATYNAAPIAPPAPMYPPARVNTLA